MKKDTIVQFVGFVTKLDWDEFMPQWEKYAHQFTKKAEGKIQQRETATKSGFKYLSLHELPDASFQFNFMKGRTSEHFPEQRVKVVQTGGYLAEQLSPISKTKGLVKIVSFIHQDEVEMDFYKELPEALFMNIYQAYYENCAFSSIIEYFTTEQDAASLLEQLQSRIGNEAAIYCDHAFSAA